MLQQKGIYMDYKRTAHEMRVCANICTYFDFSNMEVQKHLD